MNPSEYLRLSERTERKFQSATVLLSPEMEMLHHTLGVVTEAGELADALKKFLIYGKELDRTNVLEEVGDVLWYLAGILRLQESTFEVEMARNIVKLQVRFPSKFTAEDALSRDLDAERNVLLAVCEGVQNTGTNTNTMPLAALRSDAWQSIGILLLAAEPSAIHALEAYLVALEALVGPTNPDFGSVSQRGFDWKHVVTAVDCDEALLRVSEVLPLQAEVIRNYMQSMVDEALLDALSRGES